MSSLAPCLHEEADTRMFARATEAAKRLKQENKQLRCWYRCISSGQLWVAELRGWQKIAG